MKGGRHLMYPEDTPMSNLLLTILDKAGVPQEKRRRQHGPAVGAVEQVASGPCRDGASYAIDRTSRWRCVSPDRRDAGDRAMPPAPMPPTRRSGRTSAALRALVGNAGRRQRARSPTAPPRCTGRRTGTTSRRSSCCSAPARTPRRREPLRRHAAVGGGHVRQAPRWSRRCSKPAPTPKALTTADGETVLMTRRSRRQRRRRCGCCSIAAPT